MIQPLVLMSAMMTGFQVSCFRPKQEAAQILVTGRSVLVNTTHFPGSKCGYGKEDVDDSTTGEVAFNDPRAHGKDFSIGRGFASKLIRISRAILNIRAIGLELTGDQAQRLVYAQYGITYARVPRDCFQELREALSNDGKSWGEIKARRANLRDILRRLPVKCSKNSSAPKSALGRTASKKLDVLYNGCWTIYEPMTNASLSMIGVRSLDELRYRRRGTGDRLRQIWHFAKVQLLVHTDLAVREEMLAAVSNTEKRRLHNQMWNIIKLQGLRDARLEFVEIDGLHNCVSAQPHEVENLIAAIRGRSGEFRVTLMYRERAWQAMAKAPMAFLTHPLYSLRKSGRRTADEWHRTSTGHRIAMLLKPIATAATLAGVVIGVLTGGAMGLGLVIANALIAQGAAIVLAAGAAQGFLDYILFKLIQWPLELISNTVSNQGICAFFQNWKLQSMFQSFDDSDLLADARFKLNREVESLMESPEVVETLKKYDADHSDGHIVEEEVRRYVMGLVIGGFVDEIAPIVHQVLDKHTAVDDPNFGWLNWYEWKRFRKGDNSKLLKHLRVRGEGIVGVSIVQEVHWRLFGRHKVTLVQESEVPGDWMNTSLQHMTLTHERKAHMFVEDIVAYKRLRSGWLLWHDWVEYRKGKNGRNLIGKMIQFDMSLQGCEELVQTSHTCLNKNKLLQSAAVVRKTSWKPFGHFRYVYTNQGCLKGFALSSPVKKCLRIHDAEAYQRFVFDYPRRQAEEAWLRGGLTSSFASSASSSRISSAASTASSVAEQAWRGGEVDILVASTASSAGIRNTTLPGSSFGMSTVGAKALINGSSEVEQAKQALFCPRPGQPQASFADIGNQVLTSVFGAGSVGLEMDDPAGMGSDEDHAALAKDIVEHVGSEVHVNEEEVLEILKQAREGFQEEFSPSQSACD